jgi:AcrR family transcriptional regulator
MPAGRPRDAAVDERVLAVARELLAVGGHGSVTVEAVATGAGVAKTTLYRRWPTRAHLLAAVAGSLVAPSAAGAEGRAVATPRASRCREDVRREVVDLLVATAEALNRSRAQGLLGELLAAADQHAELGDALRDLATSRRADTVHALERAVARGELRPGADVELLVDQLVGPLHYRVLVLREELSPQRVQALVDSVLAGWRAAPPDRS